MSIARLAGGLVLAVWTPLFLGAGNAREKSTMARQWPQYESNPTAFTLVQPPADESAGGITVADLDGDGLLDFLYTTPGSVGAYDHWGRPLWVQETDIRVSGSSEREGLPGIHHPGVQAADVDGDGEVEAVFLLQDGALQVVEGRSGKTKLAARPPVFGEAERWESFILCNLRGQGDRDIVLQATNPQGYRVGHYLQAMRMEALEDKPLWRRDDFGALAHGPARAADLNGDGRDEIAGFTIVLPDGTSPTRWRYPPISDEIAGGASFHIDSLFIYDVRPDLPGLEVVLLEEGRNYVALVNLTYGIVWHVEHEREEPQNAAVGDFDPGRPGLEIWCRSRYNEHQKPWLFDSQGQAIFRYEMDEVAPPGWTVRGIEEIAVIDWTGHPKQLAAAKERHKQGDVCIFDPMTGKFLVHLKEQAARLFVADVSGDWREELLVVSGNEVHIYWNEAPNPNPERPRLWESNHYRRSKMNWNYYSP